MPSFDMLALAVITVAIVVEVYHRSGAAKAGQPLTRVEAKAMAEAGRLAEERALGGLSEGVHTSAPAPFTAPETPIVAREVTANTSDRSAA
ncbi:hypothetical protein [Albirhodobacter sp. R86504]|uniref:hypothetical protein n=1 Tax=Albirhodobacter sp. R86504 TaxID=3093848 RepID=UPI0036727BBF